MMRTRQTATFRIAVVFLLGLAFAAPSFADHPPGTEVDGSVPDVTFTLRTAITGGQMVFIGDAGQIKDKVNPDLHVAPDSIVQINLINDDGAVHDIALPEFGAKSDQIIGMGAATAIVFRVGKDGSFEYFCTLPGHKAAGMVGKLIVGEPDRSAEDQGTDVSKNPMEVGEPVGKREPKTVTMDLEATELVGRLSDGSTYKYWTFNDTVPGPMLRARVGDTVQMNLSNAKDSTHIHSIDLHAVTGPGGGAAVTQVSPGHEKSFSFKPLHPGLYVYHCATPMVAQHITNGMYGLILIEPEGGLKPVDREFYIMQGELYTAERHGSQGLQEFSYEKLLDERPEHFMFNGSMGALTNTHRMEANVGETVRIFFGDGGPNMTSSFHVIGEVFDRVYDQASLTSPPLTDVQTTTVAPGGATMVEFGVDYPGRYVLVDHALSRMEKGLVGFLHVDGEADAQIFQSDSEIEDEHASEHDTAH